MKPQKRTGKIEFEIGSANVYADLRYSDPEAMLVKAQLVTKIAEILDERGLTQSGGVYTRLQTPDVERDGFMRR